MTIQNETNELTQEMISHILQLHESGLSQKAIRINLYEVYNSKVSLSQINMITDKVDHLVNEWLASMVSAIY
jgi:transposase-like protein